MIDKEKTIKSLELLHEHLQFQIKENDKYKQYTSYYLTLDHACIDAISLLKEQEAEIRQLRLALDIAKGTCNGIKA